MTIFDKYPFWEGKMLSIMDLDGNIVNKDEKIILTDDQILENYKIMQLSRLLDTKMLSWQRQGKFPSFLTSTGQEATEVGYASQLRKGKDWFVPAYRNSAAFLTLGVQINRALMFWLGNEHGSFREKGQNILPIAITIGAQYSHAVGLAYADKYKGNDHVSFVTIGDGGTSEGEFFEAMNMAAVHKLPVVFIVENNGYALTTPKKFTTMTPTFAQKAKAVEIPSMVVDGNDLLASSLAAHEAHKHAQTKGPVLLEFKTYRIGAHSSSDDANAYRVKEIHDAEILKDPLIRVRKYLTSKGLWSDEKQTAYEDEKNAFIDSEFDLAQKNSPVNIDDIFKYTYHEIDSDLKEQWNEAKKEMGGK